MEGLESSDVAVIDLLATCLTRPGALAVGSFPGLDGRWKGCSPVDVFVVLVSLPEFLQ